VLEEALMVEMLTEISLIEGARSGTRVIQDSLHINDLYVSVFQKHEMHPDTFRHSLEWYTEHPDRILPVWDRVIENLVVMETQYGAVPDMGQPVVLPDSIKMKADSIKKRIQRRIVAEGN
jgi:hypothetical protein